MSISSPGELTPMQVDALLLDHPNPPSNSERRQLMAFRIVQQSHNSVFPAHLIGRLSSAPIPARQTARRGGRGGARREA